MSLVAAYSSSENESSENEDNAIIDKCTKTEKPVQTNNSNLKKEEELEENNICDEDFDISDEDDDLVNISSTTFITETKLAYPHLTSKIDVIESKLLTCKL